MRLLIALLVCIAWNATPALACWDGHLITADRVQIRGVRDTWDVDHVRAYGRWIPRIQAILPSGYVIRDEGINLLCPAESDDADCVELKASVPDELFEEVARHVKADAKVVRAARAMKTSAWTIQLAAAEGTQALLRRAETLNTDLGRLDFGFAEYGGFPADNPVAFVVPRNGAHTSALIVGSWLDIGRARATLKVLKQTHGLDGFVRRL